LASSFGKKFEDKAGETVGKRRKGLGFAEDGARSGNGYAASPSHPGEKIDLVGSVRRGATAVLILEVIHQVLNLLFLAVLYRTLGVEPFGLIAMVMPLLYLSRILVFSGLDVATIQYQKLDLSQVSALFWVQQFLGLGLTFAVAALAPLVAWFYGEPRLLPVTVAVAGTNLATTLGIQHFALLQRRLRLGLAAFIRLCSGVLGSLAAIAAAVGKLGVWALVIQMYVELFSFAVLSWLLEPFWPRLCLRGVGARGLLQFGGQCTWANLMFFLATQFDKIAVGYVLGTTSVALYSQAYNLASKPIQLLMTRLSGIMLPSLARAREDPPQFRELLLGFLRFIAFTMFPAGVGLGLVAGDVMRLLGGKLWEPAGPILSILALTIIFQPFVQGFGTILAACGKGGLLARVSTFVGGVLCGAVMLGLNVAGWLGDGLPVLALTYVGALGLVIFPVYFFIALNAVSVRIRDGLAAIRPLARAACLMGIGVFALKWLLTCLGIHLPAVRLAILVPAGIGVYAILTRKEWTRYLDHLLAPSAGDPTKELRPTPAAF